MTPQTIYPDFPTKPLSARLSVQAVLMRGVFLLSFGLLGALLLAQGFGYQAVARDAEGLCLSNQMIDVRIGIRDSSTNGLLVYLERHDQILTNEQGLFSISIGMGIPQGTPGFNTLDWSVAQRWLEIEIDAGNGFVAVGSQQLMCVPYAKYADGAYIPHAFSNANNTMAGVVSTLRNQWLIDAGVEITVPESGAYHISASGRAWNMNNDNGEWARFRVFNVTTNTELAIGFIGHVEAGSGDNGNGDQTGAVFSIASLQEGDVLRLEFWIRSTASVGGSVAYGGDQNGRSSLSILKVAP